MKTTKNLIEMAEMLRGHGDRYTGTDAQGSAQEIIDVEAA